MTINIMGEDLSILKKRFAMRAEDHEGGAVPLGLAQKLAATLDGVDARVTGLIENPVDKEVPNIVIQARGEELSVSADLLIAAHGYAEVRAQAQVDQISRLGKDAGGYLTAPFIHMRPAGT